MVIHGTFGLYGFNATSISQVVSVMRFGRALPSSGVNQCTGHGRWNDLSQSFTLTIQSTNAQGGLASSALLPPIRMHLPGRSRRFEGGSKAARATTENISR
jgi:hypothetical protein